VILSVAQEQPMRISLFGGPGLGKSTLAAKIFSELKIKGHDIELVSEYIKNWAYDGRKPKGFDQLYVFAKQIHAEDVLIQSGVKHLVTDSPIMMQVAYAMKYNFSSWAELLTIAQTFETINPSINIFLDRTGIPYEQKGRYENYKEALTMDDKILDLLKDNHMNYHLVNSKDFDKMLNLIEAHL
jgi:hypothetical protein